MSGAGGRPEVLLVVELTLLVADVEDVLVDEVTALEDAVVEVM